MGPEITTNNVKIEEIYDFYTNSDLGVLKKFERKKDEQKNIHEEIEEDRKIYEKQMEFITQYMQWHFRLTDISFLKNKFKRKTNFVYKRVAISPDGKIMARVDYDKNITICSIDKNSKIEELFTIYDCFVASANIRFCPISQKLAFLDTRRNEINVWNIQKKQREFVIKECPNFLVFSKVGDYIGVILENGLQIYKNDFLISETIEIKGGGYLDFANQEQNQELVCVVVDQKIFVWNFINKKTLFIYEGNPEASLNSAYFLHNDSKIIAASMNQIILIWDFNLELKKIEKPEDDDLKKKESVIYLREHSGNVKDALISEDESYIVSYEVKKGLPLAYIWQSDKGDYKLIKYFNIDFTSSCFSFSDRQIMFLGYDSSIHRYDVENLKERFVSQIQFGKRALLSAYSPDNSLLGKFSRKNIFFFKTESGECSQNIDLKITPLALAFSPDSSRIAITSKEELFIYEIPKEKGKKTDPMIKPAKLISPVHLIKYINSKQLITGDKIGQILFWTVEGNELEQDVVTKNVHECEIRTISIDPKEEMVCSGDTEGKIAFWNISTKKVRIVHVHKLCGEEIINAKFFNKVKKCLIGDSKGRFAIFEIPSESVDQGKNPYEIVFQSSIEDCLLDFDLGFDNRTVVSIYLNGSITLWNLEKKEIIRVYQFYDPKDMDKTPIEILFKANSCNTIIIRAKESYKEINLDPEVTELENVPLIKAATKDRKLISLEKAEGKIIVTNLNTNEQEILLPTEKQELQSCFLSIDGSIVFAYNFQKYFLWNLDGKEKNPSTYDLDIKKELHVAYQKSQKNYAYVASPTKGMIYIWIKDREVFGVNSHFDIDGELKLAIQLMSGFDLSREDNKMLIEYDNNKLLVLELEKKKWKKTKANFNNANHNTIFLSKFSAKTDNIYNVMIENNEHRILEWDFKTGSILHNIRWNSTIVKMIVEPIYDNLFVFTSKDKKNNLELFSFKNNTFIHLSDAENEQPENFFYTPETTELILLFNDKKIKIFHDFYKNSYFILEKQKKLSKIFENEKGKEDNIRHGKTGLTLVKNKEGRNKTIKLDNSQLIAPYTRMFPFNYNFLQIMAYDKDYRKIESYILELLKDEKKSAEKISFDLFFQKDIHGRNCFDIAFASKNTKLFKDFLIFIKSKFKISEIQNRYHNDLNSKFFYKMFMMFEDNEIMSNFLNFVFGDPLEFPKEMMSKRMKEPILEVFPESRLPTLKLKKILENHKNNEEKAVTIKNINDDLDEQVMAKCLYPCELLDYNNPATREIFKKVAEFEPINPIFESIAIVKLLEYKWTKYAKKRYFSEAFWCLIFLVVYLINVDFLFIVRMGTNMDSDTQSSHLAFSICSGVIDAIIFGFVFRLIYHEWKQYNELGRKDYFNSIWNINDILYISFSMASTSLDLCSCLDVFDELDVLKAMQSLTIFFSFFRLMSYARGIEESSFMIKLIIRVINDIRYFLFLMILFIISLACSGKRTNYQKQIYDL